MRGFGCVFCLFVVVVVLVLVFDFWFLVWFFLKSFTVLLQKTWIHEPAMKCQLILEENFKVIPIQFLDNNLKQIN